LVLPTDKPEGYNGSAAAIAGATMSSSEVQIANLLGRYAEYIDSGDFVGASELFRHAKAKVQGRELDYKDMLNMWETVIIRYEDGTPKTKHVITNLVIEVDEAKNTGAARSYYTVFQQIEGKVQAIVAGRYLDWFERVDGVWRWSYRDYSQMDLDGDRSHHNRAWP
jgi:hypothetical protein